MTWLGGVADPWPSLDSGRTIRQPTKVLPRTGGVRWDLVVATQNMKLPEFVDALRGRPFIGEPQVSFSVRSAPEFFVNPELLVKEGLDDLDAGVILISARGAAGKTTAAHQVSYALGAPLWKLEEDAAVSATALSFVLGRYMGTFEPELAVRDLDQPTILIDSLDEARARVSGTSWTQFIESLAAIAHEGVRLILLGRERTLEDVWLTLDDAGVKRVAWLEISHFGPAERLEYVDGGTRRKAKHPQVVGTQHYVAARDAILASLVGSLPAEAADVFVGYAPVLDAVVAVLSNEENLFATANAYGSARGGTRALEELRRILDQLLAREQAKVSPLASDLGIEPAATYTPDEQIDWLRSALLDGPPPGLQHLKDPEVRAQYIARVSEFLNDHPFRSGDHWASAVFAAYVAWKRFHSVPGPELLKVGNDSGLLFDFFSLDGSSTAIDEKQFGALHASITAGEFSGVAAAVAMVEQAAGEHEAHMRVVRAAESLEARLTVFADTPDQLKLFGPLEALTVVTGTGVTIPARQPATVLGPDLFIRCGSLTIEGGSVEFAHRAVPSEDAPESGQVVFEVAGELALPPEIARGPLTGDFELAVPDTTRLHYPWVTYRQRFENETTADPSGRAERFLNMLMNLTRLHGHHGDRGTFVMKLQGRQSVKGEELRGVLAALTALGVVRLEDDMVYVTQEWEKHRFSGKTQAGQRLLTDLWEAWEPVVEEIKKQLRS